MRAPGKAAIHSGTRAWRSWCALVWSKPRCCQDTLRPRAILAMFGCATGLTALAVPAVIWALVLRVGSTRAPRAVYARLALDHDLTGHVWSVRVPISGYSSCSRFCLYWFCLVCYLLKDSMALCTVMISQVVSSMQVLGIFDIILVVWPEPFAPTLLVGSLLKFDVDILNVNCVVSAPALLKYVGTLLLLVSMLMVMLLIHCFCVLCFYGGRFRERRPSLIAATGTTVMALLISFVSSIVAPPRSFLCCSLHVACPS